MSFMDKLMFYDLTFMLDKCVSPDSSSNREKFMKKYMIRVLDLQKKYKAENAKSDANLYPLIRILLSTEEKERAYGLQEKSLRKILVNSLKIAGTDARKIEQCNENDIADTVYEAVKARSSRESQLTISQVDSILNELCENQKQQAQQKQFEYLFTNGSASDFKWIVKIILKNMKTKVHNTKILEYYHALAPKLYLKYNHLSKVCEFVENGQAEEAVKDVAKPFTVIRPMLSQKFSSSMNNILEKFVFYQEIKLDGERFQMHKENEKFMYFSRNAHDFSDNFNAILSPLIKFKGVVHSVILDGEMILWNKNKKKFVTKGETDFDVKKLKDPNHSLRPCYCAFDVLYLNGVSYIEQPYSRRCEILNSLFDDQPGIFIKTKPVKIRDVEHLVTLFNEAIQNEEEGIILKKSESIYMPGERDKSGWYKVKADYFDGELVQDFDCVIVGGTYQNPFKKDYLLKYHVGIVEKIGEENFNVYVIGEINHGLSIDNRRKLNEKLTQFAIDFPRTAAGDQIDFDKGQVFFGKSKPNVFIPPNKSIVLQIRASELAKSSDYHTEFTFRFSRITEVRYDKFWDDSMTLVEYKDIIQSEGDRRVRKINKREASKNDIISPTRTKKRKVISSRQAAIDDLCRNSQEDVEPIDNVLDGKEFCVLSTSLSLPTVHDLKILLKLHGGSITEFPRKSKTFAIVAGDLQQKVKIYKGTHSALKAEWVAKNLPLKQRLNECPELRPNHFHFIDEAMKDVFSTKFDEFGDSYTEPIKSGEELMEIINSMDISSKKPPTLNEIKDFEAELYNENFPNPTFFRGLNAFFCDVSDEKNYAMEAAKSIFSYRAGHITSTENDLVFVHKSDFKMDCKKKNDVKYVDFRFILKSNMAGKMLDIDDFVI